jgi:hypothetical protein
MVGGSLLFFSVCMVGGSLLFVVAMGGAGFHLGGFGPAFLLDGWCLSCLAFGDLQLQGGGCLGGICGGLLYGWGLGGG